MKARCKNCNAVIESKSRHDFVTCNCFSDTPFNTGFALDGGKDYLRVIGNFDAIEWINEEPDDGIN